MKSDISNDLGVVDDGNNNGGGKYSVGRLMANGIIIIGWIVVAILCFASLAAADKSGPQVLIFLPVFILGGVINHGFSQIMLAIFDIADNTSKSPENSVKLNGNELITNKNDRPQPKVIIQDGNKECPKCGLPITLLSKRCSCGATLISS